MSSGSDHRVLGVGQLSPQLRGDLLYYPQELDGEAFYLIEDPLTGKFVRVCESEYTFLSRLDGRQSVHRVIADVASELGPEALDEHEATSLVRWAVEQGLVTTSASRTPGNQRHSQREKTEWRWLAWNPIFWKVRIANPDRWLDQLYEVVRSVIGWPLFVVWCCAVVLAVGTLTDRSDQLARESIGILARENWFFLAAVWLVLKLVHEIAHGLACKAYRLPVPECGLVWILFSPIAYVDATAAWRLSSKWQRAVISLAGMYVEILIAAIAACLWGRLEPGVASQQCYNIMVAASISTVVFNANPLMRFDGYYVLSDLWEIPNLSGLGRQYLVYLFQRYFCGMSVGPVDLPKRRRFRIKAYAVLAAMWRVVVTVGILVTAYELLWGAGLLFVIIALLSMVAIPVVWSVRQYRRGALPVPAWSHISLSTVLTGLVFYALYAWIPWPGGVSAPAIVEGQDKAVVRILTEGFVGRILVQTDQIVAPGDLLVTLDNHELTQEIADLELQIAQSQLRRKELLEQSDVAAEQSQRRFEQALAERLLERRADHDRLAVRAPIAGRVLTSRLAELHGTFLPRGATVLEIASDEKQLRMAIHQDDRGSFQDAIGGVVRVRTRNGSGPSYRARLTDLQPNASSLIPELSLTTLAGGPLPVRPVTHASDGSPRGTSDEANYELLAPRFVGLAQLVEASRGDRPVVLRHGELAEAVLLSRSHTVGRHVTAVVRRWINHRLGRTAEGTEQNGA